MKVKALLAAVAAAVLSLGLVSAAGAQAATGLVTVVHGVPGLTVDVYVNGDLTLEDFAPDAVTDALELPAGNYDVEVFPADADPQATDPAMSGSVTLPAGANASVVAHLAADGTPTLSAFVNDVSPIASGEARLVVRHTAAAPAVDVLADGDALFTDLANPDEVMADVPAGMYSAAVAAAGTTDPVIGPADLTLVAGTEYIVYAVGSLADGNLGLLLQSIPGLGAAELTSLPQAGSGGVSTSWAWTAWLAAGLAVMGVLVLGGTAALARSRARNR